MEVLSAIFMGLGVIMYMAGGIWMLVVAFSESIGCGLLYLFAPFYSLYYIFSRWNDGTRKPFFLWLSGVVTAFLPYVMVMGLSGV